jgi:hypothetical protein
MPQAGRRREKSGYIMVDGKVASLPVMLVITWTHLPGMVLPSDVLPVSQMPVNTSI